MVNRLLLAILNLVLLCHAASSPSIPSVPTPSDPGFLQKVYDMYHKYVAPSPQQPKQESKPPLQTQPAAQPVPVAPIVQLSQAAPAPSAPTIAGFDLLKDSTACKLGFRAVLSESSVRSLADCRELCLKDGKCNFFTFEKADPKNPQDAALRKCQLLRTCFEEPNPNAPTASSVYKKLDPNAKVDWAGDATSSAVKNKRVATSVEKSYPSQNMDALVLAVTCLFCIMLISKVMNVKPDGFANDYFELENDIL